MAKDWTALFLSACALFLALTAPSQVMAIILGVACGWLLTEFVRSVRL